MRESLAAGGCCRSRSHSRAREVPDVRRRRDGTGDPDGDR
ncbi:hypothetical protein STTU_6023 [Streptomyces sp. Tu6071]|nr:hypothetical protein STTU_6023 [Streptomyces sp. Tu6071]